MNDAQRVMLENQRRENHEAAGREREKQSPYQDFARLNREEIPHLERARRIRREYMASASLRKDGGA